MASPASLSSPELLIEKEARRRRGTGKKRKQCAQKPGSRHVAVTVANAVWERDESQCTFVDAEGRRCSARRFLTLEHVQPHSLKGPPTVENLSLSLCKMGFRKREVFPVLAELRARQVDPEPEPLLRASLALLVP
ncbi:MAG TPA: hypothetical protein VK524_00055 [Polyangiaceae bacterium]|nr:hypothetical protein [Polyangiaceae bacterium]